MAIVENVEAFAVRQALSWLDRDPEKNLPKLLDWFDRFDRKDTLKVQRDVIRLCEDHPDCVFSTFTNGTLIDEAFADEMLRVKNFVPAISIEGLRRLPIPAEATEPIRRSSAP